jgi:hypothetical protein
MSSTCERQRAPREKDGVSWFRVVAATVGIALTGLSFVAPSYGAAYHIPTTIPGDCSVDVSGPILSWIASVPDNSTLEFGTGACYRVDETLELRGRSGLDLVGNGAAFKAVTTGDAWRAQWRVVDSSNFGFRDMTIRGANPNGGTFFSDRQWQHAIDLRGVAGVEIAGVNVSDLYGDCLYLGQGLTAAKAWTRGVHVHDSSCVRNGRMGIAVTAARNVLVESSSFGQIARTAFDVEPNGPGFGAQDITFRGNRATGAPPGGFFTAIGDGPVDSVTVSSNRLTGGGMYMAVLARPGQRRSNIRIAGNSSDTGYNAPGSAALDFERVYGMTVTGNTIPLSGPNMALASVSESCEVSISGNRFPGGVIEARVARYPCPATPSPTAPPPISPSPATPPPALGRTSLTLRVTARGVRGGQRRSSRTRRAYGRVRGSRSGRVVIRFERFARTRRDWVKVRTRTVRLGRGGRFATRLRGLRRGRWRARARFRGTRNQAPSRSPLRYFLVR